MDFILICFIIFYNLIAFFINLRLIYIFEDAEDSKGFLKQALISRIVVVLGLQLIWANFMLVPVNIINEYPIIGSQEIKTINVRALFITLMYLNVFFTCLVVPFSMFFYETQFDTKIGLKKSYTPYLASFISTLVTWVFIGINYAAFREVHLGSISTDTCQRLSNLGYIDKTSCTSGPITLDGTFSISVAGLLLFVGYVLNVLFMGAGSVLIPMKFLFSIINRPKPIEASLYREKKQEIYVISRALYAKGEDLKTRYDESSKGLDSEFYTSTYLKSWQENRAIKQRIYKFKGEVIALSSYLESLENRFRTKGQNAVFILTQSSLLLLTVLLTLSIYTVLITKVALQNPPSYSANQFVNMAFIIFSLMLPVYIGACICYTWNTLAKKVCYCLPIHVLSRSQTPMNSMIFIIGIVLIPMSNIIYITDLSNSWLFKSDLYYIFLLASNTRLNYKLIPNQVLMYSLFGVSLCSIVLYLFSFFWDRKISAQEEVPKILTKYLDGKISSNSKK